MKNDYLSEKVSVNMNTSILSNIDLLVDNGYFSNRSDFINQAVREAINNHQETLNRIICTNMEASKRNFDEWFVGVYNLDNGILEEAKKSGQKMRLSGYGVLIINKNIDKELLYKVVDNITVRGSVIGSPDIKEYYEIKK